ncbi:MAG: TetR/AcrR family transcriptional regulator, partial [Polyangiaceae bacterium]
MTTSANPLMPRKRPRQRRSRATVEAILEATARVLVEEGFDRASTNRIAKVAGVSVGSLYQYFPSKEALIHELVRRHCEQMVGMLARSVDDLGDAPIDEAVRSYVHALVQAHAMAPDLHRVLITQALHVGFDFVAAIEERARSIVREYLDQHRHEILPEDTELAAFVLVSTVESITHRVL